MTITPPRGTVSQTQVEVESQPDIWARVIAEAPVTTPLLPTAGEPVLFIGCGTSYYVGESYARRRSSMGLGRTRAAIASEIPWVDADETIVVLSRSGTTTDLVRAVERVRGNARVIGIIGEADTPVAEVCDHVILLDYADEQSVVQTRFATSAVALLRASLGEDLASLPDQAREALSWPPIADLPQHLVFLGSDWTIGLAHEAALKCREAAGAWTEAYPIMEYQHGPIAVAGPQSLVWSLTPMPDFVREPIEATGARVLVPTIDALAQLPAIHRVALQLADRSGRDPDHPLFLSRSVLLD
ncbi:SIS domain-containing protein [Acidothermaceae bacterium B102]|nr:SIS domain-containing protein [Acidothermaceae bacterium B102]